MVILYYKETRIHKEMTGLGILDNPESHAEARPLLLPFWALASCFPGEDPTCTGRKSNPKALRIHILRFLGRPKTIFCRVLGLFFLERFFPKASVLKTPFGRVGFNCAGFSFPSVLNLRVGA